MKVKNKSPWIDGLPPKGVPFTTTPKFTGGHPNCTNIFFNDADHKEEKHEEKIHFSMEENAIRVKDEKTLMFSKPVIMTDTSEMWSGAKYDIKTMDIDQYSGKLNADHRQGIQYVLGKVIGLKKIANNKVTIDGIELAVAENPLADFAKRMILAGYLTDFSIETIGPWPDDDGIFHNAKLVGIALVVTGNNKQAHINQIAMQSIDAAKKNGLNIKEITDVLKYPIDNAVTVSDNNDMKFKKILNDRAFAVEVTYKNSAGEDTTVTLQANQSIEVIDNDANKGVEDQVKNAVAPKEDKKIENKAGDDLAAIVTASVNNAIETQIKPLTDQIKALEQNQFDNGVTEPGFVPMKNDRGAGAGKGKIADLPTSERNKMHINAAYDAFAKKDQSAMRTLNEINKYNLEELQKAGKVDNAITMGDMGNFVISTELLTTIEGFRSNYQPLISKTAWRDTLSLDFAWLKRSGDINMQNVDFCEDDEDDNANVKPLSEYGATLQSAKLEELAAVTPVCDAATRFLAVDILPDIAEGYRTDYDRKRAQAIIARLQQAVNATGYSQNYNTTAGDTGNPLMSLLNAAGQVGEQVDNGIWIMSNATYFELLARRIKAATAQDQGFDLFTTGDTGQLLGRPYVVVPNDLMPKLGSNQTRTFSIKTGDTVGNVTINHGLFLADLSYFTGRSSGGLNYTMSTEAAYEDGAGNIKSAFSRDELVMRGFFFRGAAFRDNERVAGVKAVNFS